MLSMYYKNATNATLVLLQYYSKLHQICSVLVKMVSFRFNIHLETI